jgi:hypothetical protein
MDQGNRIDSRARGNATQMLEKYKKMAHDAQMNGDRVATEYYLQFADHYFRVLADNRARQDEYRRPREDQGRDLGGDYADDEDDGLYGAPQGQGQRNYAQDQADDANARGQDDDGEEQDEPRNQRRDNPQRQDRQNSDRQGNERRERRPRAEREDARREDTPRQERAERQPRQRQDAEARQDEAVAAPAPVEAADAGDGDAKPRRTLRGRGRPPRAAQDEGSNALDPMILPPAIGSASEAPVEAEAPKPKRRAAPRRKAAESGDMEAAAAE